MAFLFLYSLLAFLIILRHFLHPQFYQSLKLFFLRLLDTTQTIVIHEFDNDLFTAVHCYLTYKCPPSAQIFRISQPNNSDRLTFPINSTHAIQDTFDGMRVTWSLRTAEEKYKILGCVNRSRKIQFFELTFDNKYLTKVHSCYLPYVMQEAARIRGRNRRRRNDTRGWVHVIAGLAIKLMGGC